MAIDAVISVVRVFIGRSPFNVAWNDAAIAHRATALMQQRPFLVLRRSGSGTEIASQSRLTPV